MAHGAQPPGGSVQDWMSKAPLAVAEDMPIRSALARMESAGVRHLLVLDGPALSGIVSNRDLRRLVTRDLRSPLLSEPIRSIMTEDPVTVPPATPVVEAGRLLLERKIGALAIRDGERIVGILTLADALEALLAMVEGPGA